MEQCLEAHLEYKFKTICSLKAIVNSETASKNVADFYSLVMSVFICYMLEYDARNFKRNTLL